jgi:predicted CXXCH cytochrome family protein
MRCLLRYVSRKSKGVIAYQDKYIEKERIGIGQAAGEDVHLPDDIRVALHHAVIVQNGVDQFLIQSLVPSGVRLNDAQIESGKLGLKDRVRIGNYQITVSPPSAGYDLVLSVEKIRGAQEKTLEQAYSAGFGKKSGVSLRSLSWTLCLIVFALFFLLPLAGFGVPSVGGFLRAYFPPASDHAWDTGKLTRAHEYFGADCNQCHRSAFVSVRNEECLACHKELKHHFDTQKVGAAGLDQRECASCHKEHNGSQAIIRRDDGLCLDCHRDIKSVADKSELLNVEGGFSGKHPNFRAMAVSGPADKEIVAWVSMDDAKTLRESSTLFFPHKAHMEFRSKDKLGAPRKPAHLNPKLVKISERNDALSCESCHALEPGGGKMAPIEFEKHCHECHKLTFEFADPEREVPHSDAKKVKEALKNYYAAYAFDCDQPILPDESQSEENARMKPGLDAPADSGAESTDCDAAGAADNGQRRLPGAGGCAAAEANPNIQVQPGPVAVPPLKTWCGNPSAKFGKEILESTKDWVEQKAETVRHNMLAGYRACGACHRVESDDEVLPARVAKLWFPRAYFDHSQHRAMECKKCHEAATSEDSRDVLVKGIESCRECHGDHGERDKVESVCTSCHEFHIAGQYWKPRPPAIGASAAVTSGELRADSPSP